MTYCDIKKNPLLSVERGFEKKQGSETYMSITCQKQKINRQHTGNSRRGKQRLVQFVTHCNHLMTGTKDAGLDAAPRLALPHRCVDLWELGRANYEDIRNVDAVTSE